ncbi:Immunity protein 70 [Chitinophaga eiseniae]|uniref:Immunity protein 70 n=1 Tax=Chitinophaga eiseniae TaxID=634771 RepID=A0A1T4TLE8_9BACT|nr:Imm70 family immunity protein [Chitinophaga eiseniae]SKA41197.1 Immunity protein 70 [Chitinophaga eiseniae]
MAVGLFTAPIFHVIGTGDFLHSFFSTIAYRLEGSEWGSRFPVLMNELFIDGIAPAQGDAVLRELAVIKKELSALPPDQVIWDIDDLSKQPPWGTGIASTINNLADYFVTSDGKKLIAVFETAIDTCIRIQKPLIIRSI